MKAVVFDNGLKLDTDYQKPIPQKGEALVICPEEPLHIRRTERDPRALERVYQLGRKEAEVALPDIKLFLELD